MTYGEMDIALSIRLGDPVSTAEAAGGRWSSTQRLNLLNEGQRECAKRAPDESLWPLTVVEYGGHNGDLSVAEIALPSLYDYFRISYITFGEPTVTKSSTATSDGNSGGTTIVDTALTEADDYWNEHVVVITSGTHKGQMRGVSDFDADTDTLTIDPAVTAESKIAADVTYELQTITKANEKIGAEVSALRRGDITDSDMAIHGTAEHPAWYVEGNKVKFHPAVDNTEEIRFYLIQVPDDLSVTTTECAMPQWSHEAILDYAAGLGLFADVEQEKKALRYEARALQAFGRGSRLTRRIGVIKPLSLPGEVPT